MKRRRRVVPASRKRAPKKREASGRRAQAKGRHAAERSRYRVFLSYSHQDRHLVGRIADILRGNGFEPMWDESLLIGQGFDEQIKNYIAHAHVFLPVLTAVADSRKWVHQEIGYASALNVPVVPLVVGDMPEDREMLQRLHALRVTPDDLDPLRSHVTHDTIRPLVERHSDPRLALHACADYPEARAQMLKQYSEDVLALGRHGLVRQMGGLSSFHIPAETIYHAAWRHRYGNKPRGLEHCRAQRGERLALTKHAKVAGCRIIVNPALTYDYFGPHARLVRLEWLRRFLRSMDDAKCQVAIWREMEHNESVTIVGDWFSAKSVSAQMGRGYFQTIFTRHAPTVRENVAQFDEQFDELLQEARVRPAESRRRAMAELEKEIGPLRKTLEMAARRAEGKRPDASTVRARQVLQMLRAAT